ncbi:MAG: hypothetical protein L6R39_001156 [Caloplaca ligustica]|nr:MAG: hypothetical protein L6R39_001156 [Caloplaca ligustica]
MTQLTNYTVPRDTKFGWVDQPNQRGTIDIIWSCLLVIFTCVWTVLHINIPKQGEGYWAIVFRKCRWAGFAIFAPEFVALAAASQRSSARRSVPEMHAIGVEYWTPIHGFFAESGGFLLTAPDTPPFPVNTRAIHYLVEKKYLTLPREHVLKKQIWDKSKADKFAKAVAFVQSTYMTFQVIARPIQSLDISCLELVTVAFVACTAFTYYFWMDKPLGVEYPIELHIPTSMATILLEAGDIAKRPYVDTPMDFVEQPGWRAWKRRKMFRNFGGMGQRPIPRVPNDMIPPPFTLRLAYPLWGLTVSYAAIHVAGWHYEFPSTAESYIWRCSSVTMFAVLFLWGLALVMTVKPGLNFTLTLLGIWEKESTKNTPFRNWAVDAPATMSAILYFVARTVILAEAIASMRLMPSTIYQTVQWTDFLPNFA